MVLPKNKIKLSSLTMFRSTANTEASNQSVCPYLSPYPQNDQTTSLKRSKTACEASEARGAEPGGTARCSHRLCREHPRGEPSRAQPCLSPKGRDFSAERRQQLEDQRRGMFNKTLAFNYTITQGSKTQRWSSAGARRSGVTQLSFLAPNLLQRLNAEATCVQDDFS